MADDDRRAEIEAVILFACPECGKVGSENDRCAHYVGGSRGHDHYKRVPVRLTLDRVRDARGDDTATKDLRRKGFHEAAAEIEDRRRTFFAPHSGHDVEAARPPQDEDHEEDRQPRWRECNWPVSSARLRPEQPPPDALGGQPPAEPETP